jgi:hypothetical protein
VDLPDPQRADLTVNPWWSWILTILGLSGMWLAGRKIRAGWLLGVAGQMVWAAYAVATEQWGFLVAAAGFTWVYTCNWCRWGRRRKPVEAQASWGVSCH